MIRLRMWLLVLCVLAVIALLIMQKFIQSKSVAPESPAGVGEPASPPPETISPPPHYPSNLQNLVQMPAPAVGTARAGFLFVSDTQRREIQLNQAQPFDS
jgi:hypothetical protein